MKDLINRWPSNEAVSNAITQLTEQFVSFMQTPEGLACLILVVVMYLIYRR